MFIAGSRGIAVASSDTNVPQYEQIGLGLQLSATSGSQFGIDKSTYPNWKANQYPSVGTMSPAALMAAAGKALGRGAELGDYLAIVSPRAWAVLNSALATQEMFANGSGSAWSMSKETGTDKISVNHSGIKIEVVPHPFQKDGQFYLFPADQFKRIGSTDLTFAIPGQPEGQEFFFPVNGQAAMQRQCQADWQCVLLKPNCGVIGTGITY
jgi:hypothetical protein